MKFKPKTNEELDAVGLLEPGEYDFEVKDATDKTSKAGNEMIALELDILTRSGRWKAFDYILEAFPRKLNHFAKAVGLEAKYEQGEITAQDCLRKQGRCEIEIEPAAGNYPAKNIVTDYLAKQGQPASNVPEGIDDVPF